ncbi:MAG: hypothetical protein AB7V08_08595 [Elusimicrobiales bacterium]
MNPEKVQMRSDLALLRRKAAELSEEACGAIPLIRYHLPAYGGEDAVMRADTDKALALMKRLHELKKELVKTQADIKALEKELGSHE